VIPAGKPFVPEFDEIGKDINKVLESRQLTNGDFVRKLEEAVKRKCKVDYAIAFSSATQALFLLIKALKWKGRVSIPDYTWISTKKAAEWNGLKIDYIDVNRDTWVADKVNPNSKYAILVDTFGNRCDLETNIPTIYDAAHAFGLKGVGARGLAEVFSFAPMKTITACEGGVVTTNYPDLAETLREYARFFSRMPEINAIIAHKNLMRYTSLSAEKKDNFEYYKEHLPEFTFQKIDSESNYTEVSVVCKNRDKLLEKIKGKMDYRIRYEPTANRKVSKFLWDNSFILPSWIGVPRDDVVRIISGALK